MLILSKHHDYYDGVAHAGIDKTIVYKRLIRTLSPKGPATFSNTELPTQFQEIKIHPYGVPEVVHNGLKIELDLTGARMGLFKSFGISDEIQTRGIILFCGKAYPYCSIRVPTGTKNHCGYIEYRRDCFYDNESANMALHAAYKHVVDKGLVRGWELDWVRRVVKDFDHTKRALPVAEKWSKEVILDLHISLGAPIVNVSGTIESNVNLKELQFQKIVDPYTAFQEISMFIGGVLGNPEKEMTELTEKDRINQHGFDKWSFRKLPEVKK